MTMVRAVIGTWIQRVKLRKAAYCFWRTRGNVQPGQNTDPIQAHISKIKRTRSLFGIVRAYMALANFFLFVFLVSRHAVSSLIFFSFCFFSTVRWEQ